MTTTAALLTCGRLDDLTRLTAGAERAGPPVAIDDVIFPPETRVVAPRDVPKRKPTTVAGRIALIHAVAHIELSAILLALDHAHRFGDDLPAEYTTDWLRVAGEEAHHFSLLQGRLAAHDTTYGDLPVHDGQWSMAVRTTHDPLARMALVPRVNEARGVDVTPGIRDALARAGDHESAEVLDVILRDEVGHVGVGDRWFRHLGGTEERFRELLTAYGVSVRPPFNYEARLSAGFTVEELDALANDA